MFANTIRYNITFYRPNATDSEIKQAIKAAGLTEFISSLKNGLETKIGEHGRGISGGQNNVLLLHVHF